MGQALVLGPIGQDLVLCPIGQAFFLGPIGQALVLVEGGKVADLTQLSIIEQLLHSVNTRLLATTMSLPTDISDNAGLQSYKWADHSHNWCRVHAGGPPLLPWWMRYWLTLS